MAMSASIWEQILSRIETKVNRHSFYTWFKPTTLLADGGNSITVPVPNALFQDWLTKQYAVVLSEALTEVRRPDVSLVFVSEGRASSPPDAEDTPSTERPSAADPSEIASSGGLIPRYTFDT